MPLLPTCPMPSSLLSHFIPRAPPQASRLLSFPGLPRLAAARPIILTQLRLMADRKADEGSATAVRFSPTVDQIQEFISSDPSGGWERCWEEGLTPWDLRQPTPILQQLLLSKSLPKGRALVPGCGSGYDVMALASPERYVIGLDISEVAIRRAKELASSSPNANYLSFMVADFFTWEPSDLFDLIFDYTFFCAIEPNIRSAWASRMRDLLKPDGELITLMFPVDFSVHLSVGRLMIMMVDRLIKHLFWITKRYCVLWVSGQCLLWKMSLQLLAVREGRNLGGGEG